MSILRGKPQNSITSAFPEHAIRAKSVYFLRRNRNFDLSGLSANQNRGICC
jgi:hypothetical protein